ncbi:MAG TPA: c-type cytochrome [Archangium sp.]
MLKTSLLSLAVLATGCRGWETQERPIHLIKNMDTQEKGKAYRRDSTGLFADGRMMRLPVEGTVAQGQLGDDVLFEDGVDEAGEPTKAFPASVKEKMDLHVARGASRYQIYCSPCHGQNLDGLGTVAGTALDGGPRLTVAPPSLHLERISKEMVVGKIYSAIKHGVNNGNMPSYAAQIPVEDRWAIIAYVKAEQMKKDSSVPLEPGGIQAVVVTAASAEAGAQLYKAKGCNACHSIDGSRLVGPSFKGLVGRTEKTSAGEVQVDLAYVKESILQPMAKIVDTYPPAMPPQALNDLEIESVYKYLETLK